MGTLVIRTEGAPLVQGPPQGQWTYADWQTLPQDGNRYEVIGGVLYVTTAPSFFHQWIILRLLRFLAEPAHDQGLGYGIMAPIGVIMPGAAPVQPDFVFVRRERAAIIQEGRIRGVPDLIIEVLSPGNTAYDEQVKRLAYASAGVPEYAIIDPAARMLTLYALDEQQRYASAQPFAGEDAVRFACLPTITVKVGDLFAGAPDTTV